MGDSNLAFYIGILAGFIIVGITLYYRKVVGDEKKNNKLDERQKSIQRSVNIHTLFFAAFLLILSGILYETLPHYFLDLGTQNILILLLTAVFNLIESIIRGAYFGRNYRKRDILYIRITAVAYWIILIIRMRAFWQERNHWLNRAGYLSSDSINFFIFLFIALTFTIIAVGWHREKK